MRPVRFELSGTLVGRIWLPQMLATKEVNTSFTIGGDPGPWRKGTDSLYDAVCQLLNDGDFQNCKVMSMYLVTKKVTNHFHIHTEETRVAEILPCHHNMRELFADDKTIDKLEEQEYYHQEEYQEMEQDNG